MALVIGQMVVGQARHLVGGRLHQSVLAIAKRQAPEPGHALNVFFAMDVGDPDTFAFVDHHRAFLKMGLEIGQRMNNRRGIARFGGIGPWGIIRHCRLQWGRRHITSPACRLVTPG